MDLLRFGFSLTVIALAAGHAAAQSGKSAASSGAAPVEVAQCPRQALEINAETTCACPANPVAGSVWGSGPYTADSDLCTAARHAGAVGGDGGAVQVIPRPGQSGYSGSTTHGVSTAGWGSYDKSFDVLPAAGVQVAVSTLPQCGTMPSGAETHACDCPANPARGSVWGNGPYTADSDICTAALHDGYIDAAGGTVNVIRVQGLSSYAGLEGEGGVTTSDWGAYDSSITFDWNQ